MNGVIEFLLQNGANPNIKTNEKNVEAHHRNKTAAELATLDQTKPKQTRVSGDTKAPNFGFKFDLSKKPNPDDQ